jgi:hypothetical protein
LFYLGHPLFDESLAPYPDSDVPLISIDFCIYRNLLNINYYASYANKVPIVLRDPECFAPAGRNDPGSVADDPFPDYDTEPVTVEAQPGKMTHWSL